MRVTEKMLEKQIDDLNKLMGYGQGPRRVRLKSGKTKDAGKGFVLDSAYGGYKLGYVNYTKSRYSGMRSISRVRQTKKELYYGLMLVEDAILNKKRKY